MYTIDEIKEFISVLEGSSLSVLELQKEDGSRVRLEKPQQVQQFVNQAPVANIVSPAVQAPQVQPEKIAESTSPADEGKTISSPIVGVFYAAPSPDSEPYVTVGKKVKKGDTICIVEAMKCMNEIQAEIDCEIVEVLVNNGDLVEYGQSLFRVK